MNDIRRDIKESLDNIETKQRLFEEDSDTLADIDMIDDEIDENEIYEGVDVVCPYCEQGLSLPELSLSEDEDGNVIASCPSCDSDFILPDEAVNEINETIDDVIDLSVEDYDDFEEDIDDFVDDLEADITCPICGNASDLDESNLFEDDETEEIFFECPVCGEDSLLDLENLDEALVYRVRKGKKIRKKRKKRITPKQRAARRKSIKKARKRANTSVAKRNREKSIKVLQRLSASKEAAEDVFRSMLNDELSEIKEMYDVEEENLEETRKRRIRKGKVTYAPTASQHRRAQITFRKSAARKRALKKAQRKAKITAARRKARKSYRKGRSLGIY